MPITPTEIHYSMLTAELATLAGIDPNTDPGVWNAFTYRAEEVLRAEFQRGRQSAAEGTA